MFRPQRLDEQQTEEADAVHHAFGVIENVLELMPKVHREEK